MKKKFIAAFLSALLVFSSLLTANAEILSGDINHDGRLTVSDILILKIYIMTSEFSTVADLSGDGKLTVSDILMLKDRILSPVDPSEPVDPPAEPVDPPVDPSEPIPVVKPSDPVQGWNSVGESKFYYSNGEFYTGHHDIDGFKYYFNEEGVLSSYVGIDVSQWQADIDWKKVKASGVEFVILRAGGRFYGSGKLFFDDSFAKYAEEAYAAGLEVGAYFYSQAITAEEAVEEADYMLDLIKDHTMTYPIVFDCEDVSGDTGRADSLSKRARTDIAKAFCDRIEEAGYYSMIYANPDWSENGLYIEELSGYDFWLAHYTDKTDYEHPYNIWQYDEWGDVDGIRKYDRCDLNISYIDYAKLIRELGLNNLDFTDQGSDSNA